MILSKDPAMLNAADTGEYHMHPSNEAWLDVPENRMYVKGDDVGLATFDYPGMYSVHWFFKSRGKAAILTAVEMLDRLFSDDPDVKVVRGVTPKSLRGARLLAKYLGFETISMEEFADEPNELMLLTKENFIRCKEKIYGT